MSVGPLSAEVIVGKLLTVREVCDSLRLSRSTVYQLMERGVLRYLTIGRCRRVEMDELHRFVRAAREERYPNSN
jgi:excisionase family DNA binding protein